jgi:hypothetical protein
MLVAGGADGVLQFWDVESGDLIWTPQVHRSHVVGVQLDGESILTRGFGGTSRCGGGAAVSTACALSLVLPVSRETPPGGS